VQIPVYSLAGEIVKHIEVSDRVFAVPFNEAVVHQAMVRQQAVAKSPALLGSCFVRRVPVPLEPAAVSRPCAGGAVLLLGLSQGAIGRRCRKRCVNWRCGVCFRHGPETAS